MQIGIKILISEKFAFLHELYRQLNKISIILLSLPSLTRAFLFIIFLDCIYWLKIIINLCHFDSIL
jgi:hypothetical protein